MESPVVAVEYRVAREWRAQALAATGQSVPTTVTVQGTLADLPPDLRGALVDAVGVRDKYEYNGYRWGWSWEPAPTQLLLPTGEATLEEAVTAALAAHQAAEAKAAAKAAADAAAAKRRAHLRALAGETMAREQETIASMATQGHTAEQIMIRLFPDQETRKVALDLPAWENPARQAATAEREAREQAEAQAFRSTMEAWARDHGSDRLRRAIERGYKAVRTYAEERGALEAPGWIVDVADRATWKSRSDPSATALAAEAEAITMASELVRRGSLPADQAADVRVGVVWLTRHPTAYSWDEPQQEAIVVRGYLGRYDLLRPLGARDGAEETED